MSSLHNDGIAWVALGILGAVTTATIWRTARVIRDDGYRQLPTDLDYDTRHGAGDR